IFLSLSSIRHGEYVASVPTRTVCPPRSGTCEAGLAGAAGCWAGGRWQPPAMSATPTNTVATSHLRLPIPIPLPESLWEHRECFSSGQGTPLPRPGQGVERDAPRAPRNSSSTATRLEGRDELESSYETPGDPHRRPGRRSAVSPDIISWGTDVFLGRQGVRPDRRYVGLCAGAGRSDSRSSLGDRWFFCQQYLKRL